MRTDPAAQFEELLRPCYRGAYRFACQLMQNEAEGADLLQDALCHALERFHTLRQPDRFKPWLYRTLTNYAHNRRRRAGLFARIELALGLLPQRSGRGESAQIEREAVRKLLDGLPRPQREALVLVELAGETLETLAQVQQVPLGTAKSRLREARRKFLEAWHALDTPPILEAPIPEVNS